MSNLTQNAGWLYANSPGAPIDSAFLGWFILGCLGLLIGRILIALLCAWWSRRK